MLQDIRAWLGILGYVLRLFLPLRTVGLWHLWPRGTYPFLTFYGSFLCACCKQIKSKDASEELKPKQYGLLALGTARGAIVVWDLRKAEVLHTLGEVRLRTSR